MYYETGKDPSCWRVSTSPIPKHTVLIKKSHDYETRRWKFGSEALTDLVPTPFVIQSFDVASIRLQSCLS